MADPTFITVTDETRCGARWVLADGATVEVTATTDAGGRRCSTTLRIDGPSPYLAADQQVIIPGEVMGAPFVLVQAEQLRRLATFCASPDCGGLAVADVEPTARLVLEVLGR